MNLVRSIRFSSKYCTKSIYCGFNSLTSPHSSVPSPTTSLTSASAISPHTPAPTSSSNSSVSTTSSNSSTPAIEPLSVFLSLSQDSSQATTTYTIPTKLLNALKEYHNVYEHMRVPLYFVIPNKYPWPKELWGYSLGNEIRLMKRIIKKVKYNLEGTEFNRYDINMSTKHKAQLLIQAFRKYKEIYGDLEIKSDFVVQNNDDRWPSEMVGLNLGRKYRYIIYNGYYKDLHKELDQMGIVWRFVELRHDRFILALKTFKSIYGHLYISKTFVIPMNGKQASKWPTELRGWKFGKLLDNVRSGRVKIDRIREEVDELGFIWELKEYKWKIVENMLLTYKQQYGHLDVPKRFKVPKWQPWLQEDWGKTLGLTCYNIKKRGDFYRYHSSLKELGFVWETANMKRRRERKLELTRSLTEVLNIENTDNRTNKKEIELLSGHKNNDPKH